MTSMLRMFGLGFASGLPLLVTGSTLQAWMTDAKVDLRIMGAYALVGLPYTLKALWAPILDRVTWRMGRRKGWLLIAQGGLGVAIATLGWSHPVDHLGRTAILALAVTFFSATQDIAADAYRRESFDDMKQGLASGVFVSGYRIGMLFAGGLAVYLSSFLAWPTVFSILAFGMGVGFVTTLLSPEPKSVAPPKTLRAAVVEPFTEYFSRKGSVLILAFILLYKLGDAMGSAMTTPFLLGELKYPKDVYGAIVKTFGLFATLGGGLLGGALLLRLSLRQALWFFGFLQAASTLAFAGLSYFGGSVVALAAVIAFENLTAGMGSSAHVALMATQTNQKYTATQYALLSSLMAVPRVIASAGTGFLVTSIGWQGFFVFCTLIAIPGMLCIPRLRLR